MGETLEWWLGDGDWYDRKQQRAIEDLERSNAAARSNTRRLQQQVEQKHASLARRVDQLERALHAVVELEDVREELNEHVPAALVRRHARTVVMNISGMGQSAVASTAFEAPADVPGYWLAPAARWAASLHDGAPDRSSLDEAFARDPVRTDLFVVALSAIVDGSIDHSSAIGRLLAVPFVVTDWQRELWWAIAAGRLGPAARSTLVDGLRDAVGDVSRQQLQAGAGSTPGVTKPGGAARRLGDLADRLAPTPRAVGDAKADGGDTETQHATERDDRLAELLAVIVDEGAPGEVAVLDSMTDIRRVLATDASLQPPERRVVDRAVGEPVEVLLGDLAGSDAILRDMAVEVLRHDIASWAEELHAAAAGAAAPTASVAVFGQGVVIGADGLDESSWMDLVDAAHPVTPSPPPPMFAVVGALILLVGLLLLALVGGLGVVVVLAGVGLAGWAGWDYWEKRSVALRSVGARDAARRRTARQIEVAAKQVAAETAEFQTRLATIDGSLERILERVGAKQSA